MATLSVSDATLIEGDAGSTSALVTVRLSGSANPNVSVRYSTVNGTARAGSDYQATSGTLNFNKNDTSKTILIPVFGDRLHELDETFFVDLSSAKRATIADSRGVVTITDDDPTLTINDVTVTEGNSGTTQCKFIVTLSPAPIRTVTVNYATANDTASAGSDYQAATGTLTFNPGQASLPLAIQVNGDLLGEPNESFFVNLSNPSGAIIADGQGIATIVDDEPRVHVASAPGTEGDDAATAITFNVTLSTEPVAPVSVNYATSDSSAIAGIDYQAASATLTFAPGETTTTVNVLINADRLAEYDEGFYLNLSSAVNAFIDDEQTFGWIEDNEPDVGISYEYQAEGDAGTTGMNFTVTLSSTSDGPVFVEYATADLNATEDSDYQSASGMLTFANGEISQTITVLVYGDQDLEYDETFAVELSSAAAYGTILNDDGPLVSILDSSVYEGDYGSTFIYFEVSLSAPSTETVTVDFTTMDGRAYAGWDYIATSGTLTFAPGQTSQGIWVEVLGDFDFEYDEQFYVHLTSSSSNSLIRQSRATGTIVDNDYYEWW